MTTTNFASAQGCETIRLLAIDGALVKKRKHHLHPADLTFYLTRGA